MEKVYLQNILVSHWVSHGQNSLDLDHGRKKWPGSFLSPSLLLTVNFSWGVLRPAGWLTVDVKTRPRHCVESCWNWSKLVISSLTISWATVTPTLIQTRASVLWQQLQSEHYAWNCRATFQCGSRLPGGPGERMQSQPPNSAGLCQPSAVWDLGR